MTDFYHQTCRSHDSGPGSHTGTRMDQSQGDHVQHVPFSGLATNFASPETSQLHASDCCDDNHDAVGRKRVRSCARFDTGFRFGLRVAFGTIVVVLLANICLTIVGSRRSDNSEGFATLQKANCSKIKTTNTFLHLMINVLSTLLLGASNYCMQCLSSPSRADIDQAHRSNRCLDIGVLSIRNLGRIPWTRRILWFTFAFSSLPLHLFYNSAVFATLGFQLNIGLFEVEPSYTIGKLWTPPGDPDGIDYYPYGTNATAQKALQESTSWQRLDPGKCVSIYQQSFITDYSDALVVNNREFPTTKSLVTTHVIKKDFNFTDDVAPVKNVSYCLAKPVEPRCAVQFSKKLMIAVLVCNAIKGVAMAVTIWCITWEPLVTSGDAVASFLQRPDPTTIGKCLASQEDYHSKANRRRRGSDWASVTVTYNPQRRWWGSGASRLRWFAVYCLSVIGLGVVVGLLIRGLLDGNGGEAKPSELLEVGFGEFSTNALMMLWNRYSQDPVHMMLLANTPQLVLSLLYYGYNGLFTCMLLSEEWSGYNRERKALRVTSPEGIQRSTYRLQLPYRYGVPLSVISTLLHWLISQSIFLALAQAFNADGSRDQKSDISTCGYSSRAIIATIFVSISVLIVGLCFGCRRLKPGMPFVGSCSAAISAACHPPEGEQEPWMKKVMWGVVSKSISDGETEAVGHCSFSSRKVEKPLPGERYAGIKRV